MTKIEMDGRPVHLPLTTQIPPLDLINIVGGASAAERWAESRFAVVNVILPELRKAGVVLGDDAQILDFGCGCGRLLAGWEHIVPKRGRVCGADINPRLVLFCCAEIPFADMRLSNYDPPLPFLGETFDLIYSSSVFTHLTLTSCLRWASELARITKPGGTLMVSFHGDQYTEALRGLSAEAEPLLRRDGYYLHMFGSAEDTFPGSNQYATFMTVDFVEALFSGFERIGARLAATEGPSDFAAAQDIMVLRRKA